MKISQKITSTFFLFSLLPVITIGILIFISLRFYLRGQIQDRLISLADQREQQLYQLANTKFNELTLLTNNLNLQVLLSQYEQDHDQDTLAELKSLLDLEKQKNQDINEIYLLGPNGELLATTSPWVTPSDWSSQSFFNDAKTRATASFIKSESQLAPQLLFAGPITVQGDLVGIAVIDTDAEGLLLLTAGADEIGQTAEIFLFNPNGPLTPLKANVPINPASLLAEAPKLITERTRAVYPSAIDYQGHRIIGVVRYIDIFDIGLIAEIDQQEAYRPILEILIILISSSLIVIILATLVGQYLSKSISNPIMQLAHTAEEVKKGDLKQRAEYQGHDELGILAETFNDMVAAIQKADQAKSEFISLASHQLRTPLSSIKWTTELLFDKKTGRLNQKQTQHLTSIQQSTRRMAALINSLLDVSRIEGYKIKLKPQPVDLRLLIEDVLADLHPRLTEKKLKLQTHLPDLPKINLDIELISVAYRNLLSNAIKYTPPGGQITLTISKEDSHFLTKITDTGVGIAQKDFKRVFKKFFRGKNAAAMEPEGSGLGLFLVKTIVDSSGGKIWFESKLGKGTSFWFTLPLTKVS